MHLQKIESKIFEVHGVKVMLDYDLAELYDVETKALNQAVKRNIMRFPSSFMFRLSLKEWDFVRSQIVTASGQRKRNISATPYAFTEHGVTMLASILSLIGIWILMLWSLLMGVPSQNKEQRNTPSSFRLRVARQGIRMLKAIAN
ncbi:MAG: ORF6N domain-containing protein [Spirochaetales bacterium]|nr:ORF6N domain-containing protein [Spirochaetales bacterium]